MQQFVHIEFHKVLPQQHLSLNKSLFQRGMKIQESLSIFGILVYLVNHLSSCFRIARVNEKRK